MKKQRIHTLLALMTYILAFVCLIVPGALAEDEVPQLHFIGQAMIPSGYVFGGTVVGGL